MPRFVLLRHECPDQFEKPSHWDFMLEWDGALRTWELHELPAAWAVLLGIASNASAVKAIPLVDHRMAYLDFEGPLSEGRGSVRRCDHGSYEQLRTSHGELEVRLEGRLLSDTVRLRFNDDVWTLEAS